jgi:hypothetical protein
LTTQATQESHPLDEALDWPEPQNNDVRSGRNLILRESLIARLCHIGEQCFLSCDSSEGQFVIEQAEESIDAFYPWFLHDHWPRLNEIQEFQRVRPVADINGLKSWNRDRPPATPPRDWHQRELRRTQAPAINQIVVEFEKGRESFHIRPADANCGAARLKRCFAFDRLDESKLPKVHRV